MQRTKGQFNRLLELDRHIRAGDYPNCLSFAADWEVAQKTIQRDIEYLRDGLGAPIEYDRERKGYYYTDTNWFLPAMNVTEGDLFYLLLASKVVEQYRGTPVAEHVEKVFRKVAEHLPNQISIKPDWVFSRFSFTSPPSKPVDVDIWETLVRGLLHKRSVRIPQIMSLGLPYIHDHYPGYCYQPTRLEICPFPLILIPHTHLPKSHNTI